MTSAAARPWQVADAKKWGWRVMVVPYQLSTAAPADWFQPFVTGRVPIDYTTYNAAQETWPRPGLQPDAQRDRRTRREISDRLGAARGAGVAPVLPERKLINLDSARDERRAQQTRAL